MIRYLLGEELMITQDDRGLILMRAPSEEERLFVGHVCFDNRVEMGSGVLDFVKWPGSVSHMWMDRRSSFPRGKFDIFLWERMD